MRETAEILVLFDLSLTLLWQHPSFWPVSQLRPPYLCSANPDLGLSISEFYKFDGMRNAALSVSKRVSHRFASQSRSRPPSSRSTSFARLCWNSSNRRRETSQAPSTSQLTVRSPLKNSSYCSG